MTTRSNKLINSILVVLAVASIAYAIAGRSANAARSQFPGVGSVVVFVDGNLMPHPALITRATDGQVCDLMVFDQSLQVAAGISRRQGSSGSVEQYWSISRDDNRAATTWHFADPANPELGN